MDKLVDSIKPGEKAGLKASDELIFNVLLYVEALGHSAKMNTLMPNGIDSNDGHIRAQKIKRTNLAKAFIELGAKVNATDKSGISALMAALKAGGGIKGLLDGGADVNAKDAEGQTALMRAAKEGL